MDRYRAGDSNIRLSADLGLSRRYINRVLTQYGFPRRKNPDFFDLPAGVRKQVVAAHSQGMSATDVERVLAVDRQVRPVWDRQGPLRIHLHDEP